MARKRTKLPPEVKQIELSDGSSAYVLATVRPTDASIGPRGRRNDLIGLVLRMVNSCVYRATDILSMAVAQTPIMLGRPSAKGSKGRKVRREVKQWLTSRDPLNGPGKGVSVMAEQAGDIEQVDDHDALALFNNPNQTQHGSEFWGGWQSDKELTGNAFMFNVEDRAGPLELWNLPPQYVRVIPSRETIVGGYAYGRGEETLATFTTDEVWHEKLRPNPESPYYGTTWMRSVVTEIDIYQASRQSELASWDHNARPDMMVVMKDPPTAEQIKELKGQLEGEHRGPKNRGKIMIVGGLDAKPMGFAPKDMEYQGGLKQIENTIMGAAGIPESLFRLNDANLASSRTGHIQFMRMTLLPRLTALTDFLNRCLLPLYPGTEGWFFYFENPVPEDVAAKTQQAQVLVAAGITTINEARSGMGLPPIEDGSVGDLLRVNGVPLAGLSSQPEPGAPASAQQVPAMLDAQQTAQMLALLEAVSGGTVAPEAARVVLVQVFGRDEQTAQALVDAQAGARAEVQAKADAEAQAAADAAETAQEPPETDAGPVKQSVVMVFGDYPPEGIKSLDDFFALPNRRRKEVLGDSPARGEPTEDALVMRLKGFFREQRDHVRAWVMEHPVPKWFEVPLKCGHFRYGRYSGSTPEDSYWHCLECNDRFEKTPGEIARAAIKSADDLIDIDAWTKKLADAFGSAIDDAVRDGAHVGAEQLAKQTGGVVLSLDLANPEAAKFAERNQLQFLRDCRTVNETTEAAVRQALKAGIEEGQTTLQIADAIAQDFNAAGPVRAVLIARTETARSYTAGQEAIWAQSGVVSKKEWLLAPDACSICVALAELNNEGVELGGVFAELGQVINGADGLSMVMDYTAISGPPAHPACRCSVTAVLE